MARKKRNPAKQTSKRYRCTQCGHEQRQTTNHFGPTWSWGHSGTCPKCPPYKKYPEFGGATIWECMEPQSETRAILQNGKRRTTVSRGKPKKIVITSVSAFQDFGKLATLLRSAPPLDKEHEKLLIDKLANGIFGGDRKLAERMLKFSQMGRNPGRNPGRS